MEQVNLSISDVSKKVEVEPRVLRYWEEELELQRLWLYYTVYL